MHKKSKNIVIVISFLAICIMLLLFVLHPYFKKPSLGGSAQADLLEELAAIYGEEYEGKVLSEKTTDGGTIQIQEDMHFSISADKCRPWNESMISVDRFGTPLSKAEWISIYKVQVEFTRYAVLDNRKYGDVMERNVISYAAYEDIAAHSCARASLDQASADNQYSTTEERFEHIEDYVN